MSSPIESKPGDSSQLSHYIAGKESRYWWYRGRREVLSALFAHFYGDRRDGKILDVGCGTGYLSYRFAEHGSVVGLDISRDPLSFCRSRHPALCAVQADGRCLPFRRESFDAVLAFDILEHCSDDVSILAELRRCLKPDGQIFVTVPAYQWLWSSMDDVANHKRRYTRERLLQSIRVAGLRPLKASYFNMLLFPLLVVFRSCERVLRIRSSNSHFLVEVPKVLNEALMRIFTFEKVILRYCRLPYGLSIFCACSKSEL